AQVQPHSAAHMGTPRKAAQGKRADSSGNLQSPAARLFYSDGGAVLLAGNPQAWATWLHHCASAAVGLGPVRDREPVSPALPRGDQAEDRRSECKRAVIPRVGQRLSRRLCRIGGPGAWLNLTV